VAKYYREKIINKTTFIYTTYIAQHHFATEVLRNAHILTAVPKQIVHTYGIKSIVNKMFQVFAHSDLSHQLVFITIHASQLTNVSKHVL
jgi:hypothetical protein